MICQTIASPKNFQLQSPFVRLPAEIQHIICGFALTANDPFVDPRVDAFSSPLDSEVRPPLGIALLQTCRRLYYEVDRRALFAKNTFRFTNLDRMQSFLKQIDVSYKIQDVELDFQRLNSDQPDIARGWLQMFSRLSEEAPNLKCLRLNFDSWPRIPMFRAILWNFLRDLLALIKDIDIERIIVVGASKGSGMAKRVPWSPVHFVGGDDVGLNDLMGSRQRETTTRSSLFKALAYLRRF
ncbi:hypothetical protein NX059_005311 [Plenodomus lindquistii]|nr:hypothetical protein NX059_005311 [Plenodomus lindquistii]